MNLQRLHLFQPGTNFPLISQGLMVPLLFQHVNMNILKCLRIGFEEVHLTIDIEWPNPRHSQSSCANTSLNNLGSE